MPRSRPSPLPDPDDVLRGRVEPRLEQLFQLIHAVNPTARDLAPEQQRAAYTRKAALQSLLIERFGEQLRIEPAPDHGEDVLGIRHRTYAKDACHAIRSQLSPAARAFVQRQADLAAEPDPAPRPAAQIPPPRPFDDAPPSTGASLAAGRAALDAYDFEGAEQNFRAVLDRSVEAQERLAAARALLELLVDHLADDPRALALRDHLPLGWDQDLELRCLLAIAAARSGSVRLARELAAAIDHPRLDEVHLEIARQALAAGEVEACAQALERVPQNRDSAAARQRVVDALQRHRTESADRLAVELESPTLAADPDAREALALRILALAPEHRAARAALQAIRSTARAAELEALRAGIEAGLAAGNPGRARAAWQQLAAAEPAHPELAGWADAIAAADHAQRAAAAAASAAELARALEGPVDARLVRAFWAADELAREALAPLCVAGAAQRLAWLIDFGPVRGHARCEEIGLAVEALCAAEAVCAAESPCTAEAAEHGAADPAAARRTLEPLAEILARGPRAARTWERIRLADEAARRDAARAALDAAGRTEDPERSRQLLDRVDATVLDAEARATLARLRERNERALGRAALEREIAGAEAGGDLIAVRRALLRLAALEPDGDAAARAAIVSKRIDAAWVALRCSGPALERDHDLGRPGTRAAVLDGALELAIAHEFAGQVFVRLLPTRPGGEARGMVLRPPFALGLVGLDVAGRRLGLLGRAAVLWIDVDALRLDEVEDWPPSTGGPDFDLALLAGGGRFGWLARVVPGLGRCQIRVVDRLGKQPPVSGFEAAELWPIPGGALPFIARSRAHSDLSIHDPDGVLRHHEAGTTIFQAATRAPDGERILRVGTDSIGEGGGTTLSATIAGPDGVLGPRLELGRLLTSAADRVGAAVSLRQGCAFVAAALERERATLSALELEGGELQEFWRTLIPARYRLVQDGAGADALLQTDDGETIRTLVLDRRPPQLPAREALPENLPDFRLEQSCGWRSKDEMQRALAFEGVLRLLDRTTIEARVADWIAVGARPALEDLLGITACRLPRAARAALVAWAQRTHPDDPRTRVLAAEHHLRRGEYGAAAEVLRTARFEGAGADLVDHGQHLMALSALAQGDAATARALAARLTKHSCVGTEDLIRWTKATGAKLPTRPEKLRGATIEGFVLRLRAADAALAEGEPERALAFLEHPSIWAVRHPQCTLRLAAAWLGCAPESGPEAFRAREVCSELVEQHGSGATETRGQEFGELAWPAERIAATVAAAALWSGVELQAASAAGPEPEPERAYPEPDATVMTKVADGADADFEAMPLSGIGYARRIEAEAKVLRAAIHRHRGTRTVHAMTGLLVGRDHPLAGTFRTAAERLLGLPQLGDDVVLPIAFETTFALLAGRPRVYAAWVEHLQQRRKRGAAPVVVLHREGAAFGRVEG
jgi:hypothetical protein